MTKPEIEHLSRSSDIHDLRRALLALAASPQLDLPSLQRVCRILEADREPAPVDLAESLGLRKGATYGDLAERLTNA